MPRGRSFSDNAAQIMQHRDPEPSESLPEHPKAQRPNDVKSTKYNVKNRGARLNSENECFIIKEICFYVMPAVSCRPKGQYGGMQHGRQRERVRKDAVTEIKYKRQQKGEPVGKVDHHRVVRVSGPDRACDHTFLYGKQQQGACAAVQLADR